MLLLTFALALAAPSRACPGPLPAFQRIEATGWDFTQDQLETLYARSYLCAQPRLPDAFQPQADGSALAVKRVQGEPDAPLRVPAAFVDRVLRDVAQVMASGRARHLFFPDFSHGHLYLDEALYRARYAAMTPAAFYQAVLSDPDLELVFHSQEMWATQQPPREFLDASGTLSPVDLTPTNGAPAGARHLFHIRFRAHPEGAYALGDGTRFDVGFQDDDWDDAARRLGVEVSY